MLPNAVFHWQTRTFLELYLLFIILVVAALYPALIDNVLDALARKARVFAAGRSRTIVLVGLLGVLSSATASLWIRFPQPSIHDEFSYLLAGDTFTLGRLTNPTHPLWRHFESYYVIYEPTYASQYPPGPGILFALGEVLFGEPTAGLWLGAGLASASIVWMLQAWVPARWTFAGGLLAVSRIGFFGYWGQTYYVATLGVTGGALVFGAIRRLFHRPTTVNSLWMSLGLFILAISRPFEGFLVSLIPLGALSIRLFLCGEALNRRRFQQVILPSALFIAACGTWLAYYNYRVTGSYATHPYQVYEKS